jgi:hypothetical protein
VALSVAVNAPLLSFEYVQDDWGFLDDLSHGFPLVLDAFVPGNRIFYRPLVAAYFWMLRSAFGLNPLPAHIIALALHTAAGLLIAAILLRYLGDRAIAWGVAALYVTATTVTMEPLAWASGFPDLGGMFFGMASLWFLINRRLTWSAVAMAMALLCKESMVFLVPLTAAYAIAERVPPRALLAHAVAISTWAVLRAQAESPLRLPASHPYAISFAGPHILVNVEHYGRWALQSVGPFVGAGPGAIGAAIVLVGVAAWIGRGAVPHRIYAACLIWIASATALLFVMPNQSFRYYLLSALPAILTVAVLTIAAPVRKLAGPREAAAAVGAFVLFASLSSAYYLRVVLDTPGTVPEGTNGLVARAETVRQVRDAIRHAYPTLPTGAVLLFRDVDIWAFNQHSGPRQWYGNPTLRVYDSGNVVVERGRPVLVRPIEGPTQLYVGPEPRADEPLDPEVVFLIEARAGEIVARPWTFR